MKISVRWLNEYLEPGNVTSDEAQHVLTHVGFPIETAEEVGGGDTCLDVEVTSNRGDVLSHIGVAREIAAVTGRRLKLPATNKVFDWSGETPLPASAGGALTTDIGAVLAVDNRATDVCALFTARVIRGVKVGPSPTWLVDALAAVGQRSINNVVDVTNFVALEYGQPSHVFDLASLQQTPDGKARMVVRSASKGEKLRLLDGKDITLAGDEIVVADEGVGGTNPRAVSLAGVMGGAETEVTDQTVDIVLEAATWEPVAVRRAARRFQIRTDASYRFERIVDPRTIEPAAKRAAGLIVRLAGGKLLPGVIHAGVDAKPPTRVSLRVSRCAAMLGVEVAAPKIQEVLDALEVAAAPDSASAAQGTLVCTIPPHRPDLEREIDLIEEVARVHGLDKLPVLDKLGVRVSPPQKTEVATREISRVMTSLGFFETITFTFVSREHARAFTPAGLKSLEVCDGRRAADPVVRPSALPSLLACRRANQDAGNTVAPGSEQELGVRLFEVSAAICEKPREDAKRGDRGELIEHRTLSFIADACFAQGGAKSFDHKQAAVRLARGVLDAIAQAMGGADAHVKLTPLSKSPTPAFDGAAVAEVSIVSSRGETKVGHIGLISQSVQSSFGLPLPVVAGELVLEPLLAMYPPRSSAHALPEFPSIERDLSLIVSENVTWARVESLVNSAKPALLESVGFVGTYRGQQAGAGKKSVTLRMRFRDARRTLTHDEVSPQVESVIAAAKRDLGAEVRVQ